MNILAQAFVLGLIGGVIPGAVLTVLFVNVLQGGIAAGLRAFLWAFLAEISIVAALLFITLQLPIEARTFSIVGGVGGGVLLYFAWRIFQLRSIEVHKGALFTAPRIVLMQITNAPLYIFWTTICVPLIIQLAQNWPLPLAAISYLAVFELGWTIATIALLIVFVYSRKTLTNVKIMRSLFIVLVTVLAAIGLRMIFLAASLFI